MKWVVSEIDRLIGRELRLHGLLLMIKAELVVFILVAHGVGVRSFLVLKRLLIRRQRQQTWKWLRPSVLTCRNVGCEGRVVR